MYHLRTYIGSKHNLAIKVDSDFLQEFSMDIFKLLRIYGVSISLKSNNVALQLLENHIYINVYFWSFQ